MAVTIARGTRTYSPVGPRVIIQREAPPKVSAGGIDLEATTPEITRVAKILACGPKCEQLKPGDIVQTAMHRGTPVEGEKNIFVLLESDIFLIVS